MCFILHHFSKSVFCFIISWWCRQKFALCCFAASGMCTHERICLWLSSDFSSVVLFSYWYNDRTWPLCLLQICMVVLFVFPEILKNFYATREACPSFPLKLSCCDTVFQWMRTRQREALKSYNILISSRSSGTEVSEELSVIDLIILPLCVYQGVTFCIKYLIPAASFSSMTSTHLCWSMTFIHMHQDCVGVLIIRNTVYKHTSHNSSFGVDPQHCTDLDALQIGAG